MTKPLSVVDKRPKYDESEVPDLRSLVPFNRRPIGDQIVVKRIPETQGLIVEADIAQDKPTRCEVVAVSQYPSSALSGNALASVLVGDIVDIRRYSGTEIKVNGQEYTIILIFDVLLVEEKDQPIGAHVSK